MEKMTQDGYRKGTAKRKLTVKDVPWLRKMGKEVKSGILSQEGASNKFKVTRHQVRKFLGLYGGRLFEDDRKIDEVQKKEILSVVLKGKIPIEEAAIRYQVDTVMIERWMNGTQMLQSKRVGKYSVNESEIDPTVKVNTVRRIQSGELSENKAANMLNVTRYSVRTWISNYSVVNLDGSIHYQMLEKMTPAEREKELIKKIEDLQKQLEEVKDESEKKDLKIDGLETLIQVAEEKLGVNTYSSPGRYHHYYD